MSVEPVSFSVTGKPASFQPIGVPCSNVSSAIIVKNHAVCPPKGALWSGFQDRQDRSPPPAGACYFGLRAQRRSRRSSAQINVRREYPLFRPGRAPAPDLVVSITGSGGFMVKAYRVLHWLIVILLLGGACWTGNLTLFNWWAASGPPTRHPEIFEHRGNVFGIATLLLFLAAVLLATLGRRNRRSNGNDSAGS